MSDCRALYPIIFIQRCAVPNLKIALRKLLKQYNMKRVSMRTVLRGQTKTGRNADKKKDCSYSDQWATVK